jgi:hypothetical protein
MSKYFISILFLLVSFSAIGQIDEDDEEVEAPKPVKVDSFSQIRFSVDVSKPIINYLQGDKEDYEFAVDYYFKRDLYFVAEAGWGSASVDYPDLKYNSHNSFIKLGIDRSLLFRAFAKDWDVAIVGVHYGIAPIKRSNAVYTVVDSFWGNTTGQISAASLTAHWIELTGGVRVELYRGLFAGWNIYGKFRLNSNSFQELPPSHIAGYGKGDKNTVFDFNFYLSYAIRWSREVKLPKVKK